MKLVRDETPGILKANDPQIIFEKAPEMDRTFLLIQKLLEEVGELNAAMTTEEKLKELGDIQEVLWAFGKKDGISEMAIFMQAQSKRSARGEFDDLQVMKVQTADERPKVAEREPPVTSYVNTYDYRGWDGPGYSG